MSQTRDVDSSKGYQPLLPQSPLTCYSEGTESEFLAAWAGGLARNP